MVLIGMMYLEVIYKPNLSEFLSEFIKNFIANCKSWNIQNKVASSLSLQLFYYISSLLLCFNFFGRNFVRKAESNGFFQ